MFRNKANHARTGQKSNIRKIPYFKLLVCDCDTIHNTNNYFKRHIMQN